MNSEDDETEFWLIVFIMSSRNVSNMKYKGILSKSEKYLNIRWHLIGTILKVENSINRYKKWLNRKSGQRMIIWALVKHRDLWITRDQNFQWVSYVPIIQSVHQQQKAIVLIDYIQMQTSHLPINYKLKRYLFSLLNRIQ